MPMHRSVPIVSKPRLNNELEEGKDIASSYDSKLSPDMKKSKNDDLQRKESKKIDYSEHRGALKEMQMSYCKDQSIENPERQVSAMEMEDGEITEEDEEPNVNENLKVIQVLPRDANNTQSPDDSESHLNSKSDEKSAKVSK